MSQDVTTHELSIRKLTAWSLVAPWLLLTAVAGEGFAEWLAGEASTSKTLAIGSLNVSIIAALAVIVLCRIGVARNPKHWELRLFAVVIFITGSFGWIWMISSAVSYF